LQVGGGQNRNDKKIRKQWKRALYASMMFREANHGKEFESFGAGSASGAN
jgi:hypothetical protein